MIGTGGSADFEPIPANAWSQPTIHSISGSGQGDERTERSIVDAVIGGDRDAFRDLVERESASVVRACYRVLGDRDEAEDAAQEAFVTAYRSLASWRGDGPFGAWLTRIAVRIALRLVHQRRSVVWLDQTGPTQRDAGAPNERGVAATLSSGPASDPAALTVRAEQAVGLRSAVSNLPEPYREVVTLRFFGELSLQEIARETDRPLGTVKTHLRRGLLRLRGTVEPGADA